MNDGVSATTIVMVDDHALVREGLRRILESQEDLRVVGEVGDSATAVALAADEKPDVILLDVEIPGGEVTSTVRQIRNCSPRTRVIILSMYEGPDLVQALLAAGVRGYLLKDTHWQELVVAIRTVMTDSDRVVLGVSRESLQPNQPGPLAETLSAREREVLALVGEALSNSQIATRLSLTEATVEAPPAEHLRQAGRRLPHRRGLQGSLLAAAPARPRPRRTIRPAPAARPPEPVRRIARRAPLLPPSLGLRPARPRPS